MPKALQRFWRDFEWPVIGLLAIVALVLGHIGYALHYRNATPQYSFFDLLYFDLKLFVLETNDVTRPFHWTLNIARFLAPVVAGYTAWQALAALFADQLESFQLRVLSGHVIIAGLGRKGLVLAREFRRRGEQVVVIEQDEENDLVRPCREHGAFVLIGDASEPELLERAGLARASRLFALCGDDGVNAEVAVRAAGIVSGREAAPLTCVVHIFDPQLCSLLRERGLEALSGQSIRLEFFNVFELGARVLVEDIRFDDAGRDGPSPHLVVIGIGRLGESLILAAARQWRASGATHKLRVTLVDAEARRIAEALFARHRGLDRWCELEAHDMDVHSANFARAQFLRDTNGAAARTSIFVCFDDDSLSLSAALAVAHRTVGANALVVARMAQDAGLARLLRDLPIGAARFQHLRAFALLDRACQPEQVLCGTREILARAIHAEYVRHQRAAGDTPEKNSSMRSWDELPETLKQANFAQADDLHGKLESIGCQIEPLVDWDGAEAEFTPDEVERLAIREHERWMAEKQRTGWRHGAVKDANAKMHPCLVPYAELPEPEKEKDRNTVRAIPKFLAAIGYRIRRVPKG